MPAIAPPAGSAAANPPPLVGASEPKKIHTVTIHTGDQTGGADTAPARQPVTVARLPAKPPAAAPEPPRAARKAPLSLVPGSGSGSAAPTGRAPMALASAASASAPVAQPASIGGGYDVQVTSQRSEGEAQTAFAELRTKFPGQLGGKDPIIRRADLGEKGIYYRAMVGPYRSLDEAAAMCSALKAAGGNCLVQRN